MSSGQAQGKSGKAAKCQSGLPGSKSWTSPWDSRSGLPMKHGWTGSASSAKKAQVLGGPPWSSETGKTPCVDLGGACSSVSDGWTRAKAKHHSTRGSRVIPQRSTNLAQTCLTSEIGRDRVYSCWYDRGMQVWLQSCSCMRGEAGGLCHPCRIELPLDE